MDNAKPEGLSTLKMCQWTQGLVFQHQAPKYEISITPTYISDSFPIQNETIKAAQISELNRSLSMPNVLHSVNFPLTGQHTNQMGD
jgi:hypothetical protein